MHLPVALITVLSLLVYLWQGQRVGAARGRLDRVADRERGGLVRHGDIGAGETGRRQAAHRQPEIFRPDR